MLLVHVGVDLGEVRDLALGLVLVDLHRMVRLVMLAEHARGDVLDPLAVHELEVVVAAFLATGVLLGRAVVASLLASHGCSRPGKLLARDSPLFVRGHSLSSSVLALVFAGLLPFLAVVLELEVGADVGELLGREFLLQTHQLGSWPLVVLQQSQKVLDLWRHLGLRNADKIEKGLRRLMLSWVLENLVCQQKRAHSQVGRQHDDGLEVKHGDFQDVLGEVLGFRVGPGDLSEPLETAVGTDEVDVEIEH